MNLLVVLAGGAAAVFALAPLWIAFAGLVWLSGIAMTWAICAAAGRADRDLARAHQRARRFHRTPATSNVVVLAGKRFASMRQRAGV